MLKYTDFNQTKSFNELSRISTDISLDTLLDAKRIENYDINAGGGLRYNYAAKLVNNTVLAELEKCAEEQLLSQKYEALCNGAVMNVGENRKVLHHLLRGQLGDRVKHEGVDLHTFYLEQKKRIFDFAKKVHTGEIKGSTGKPFDTVVQIGIGGSDLGPRALYIALENYVRERTGAPKMEAHFISNVDPDDANDNLQSIDPETTLFILVTKSGTTLETLTNMEFVKQFMTNKGLKGLDPAKHVIAVTSKQSPLAQSADFIDSFYIDNFIGGRYSSTSAVGGALLSLCFGPEVFEEILSGAHEADVLATETNFKKNAAMVDALIGVWERNFLGYPSTAVLPYSQALLRFPAHLQQLDMESNGKQVSVKNDALQYKTGPVIFGEPGTNGQHSFYQLLHQGTDIIPLQFIGFEQAQFENDITVSGSTSQKKLKANLAAQILAFALGSSNENPNKNFPGNRPSSLLYGKRLTPKALGALLAHYENKVMFQGFVWNINSFDQEGVQLGKVLTNGILSDDAKSAVTQAYMNLLSI